MAGEGLFFTGEVLKNNRKLLDEEIARQQLNIQKEQLEIQKQAAADKRKEARKKNEVKPNDYALDDMNPFYAEYFQGRVSEYQSFVTNNSLGFEDNLDLKSKKLKNEGDLSLLANDLKSRSSDLSGYKNLIKNNKGDQLVLAEDGSYLFEYNLNKQIEALQSGDMTFDEALKAYPTDLDSVIKRTEWIDPTAALFAADNEKKLGVYDNEDDGYSYKTISQGQKDATQTSIKNKLTVNSQGFHNDPNYKRLYDTKLLTIEGNEMTAKEAFFLEAYVDPETGERAEITDATNLLDILDPENKDDRFNKKASNAYAKYLARKISEEGYKNTTDERGSKITGETSAEKKVRESEEAQSKYDLDTYNYINKSKPIDKHGTGVTQYESDNDNVVNQSLDSNQASVKVSVSDFHKSMSPEALLAFKERVMKDATKEIDTKEGQVYIADDSNFTGIEINLIEVGIDGNGNVIGILQLGEGQDAPKAIIPWNQLSSAEHDTALKVEGVQRVIDYRQPKVEKKKTPIST